MSDSYGAMSNVEYAEDVEEGYYDEDEYAEDVEEGYYDEDDDAEDVEEDYYDEDDDAEDVEEDEAGDENEDEYYDDLAQEEIAFQDDTEREERVRCGKLHRCFTRKELRDLQDAHIRQANESLNMSAKANLQLIDQSNKIIRNEANHLGIGWREAVKHGNDSNEMRRRILDCLDIHDRRFLTQAPGGPPPEFIALADQGLVVRNAKGTTDCHSSVSWRKYSYCPCLGGSVGPVPCAVLGCPFCARVGAHVYVDELLYITPFCARHNNQFGKAFQLAAGALLRRAPVCKLAQGNDKGGAGQDIMLWFSDHDEFYIDTPYRSDGTGRPACQQANQREDIFPYPQFRLPITQWAIDQARPQTLPPSPPHSCT